MSPRPPDRPPGRRPPERRSATPPRPASPPLRSSPADNRVSPDASAAADARRTRRQIAMGALIAAAFLLAVWLMTLWLRSDRAGERGGMAARGSGRGSGDAAAGTGSGSAAASAGPEEVSQPTVAGGLPAAAAATPAPAVADEGAGTGPPPSEPPPEPPPAAPDPSLFQLSELREEPPAPPAGSAAAAAGGSAGEGEVQFFGAKDRAAAVVYVVDCSGSMEGGALAEAKSRLLASLGELDKDQRFQIIFYSNTLKIMTRPGDGRTTLYPGTSNNHRLARQFIDRVPASGGTDHLPALLQALSLRPEVVYLLTDGQEPRLSAGELDRLHKACAGHTRIHTIEFGEGPDLELPGNFLKALADQNGGTYRYQNVAEFRSHP